MDPTVVFNAAKWISSSVLEEAIFLYKVPKEFNRLQDDLEHMSQLLQDADQHPELLDGQLHLFAKKIQQIAFRSEDVVDTYLIYGLQSKIENKGFFKKLTCICYNSYHVYQIGDEIDTIRQDIQATTRRLQDFGLAHRKLEERSSNSTGQSLQNAPGRVLIAEEEFIVGVDDVIAKLVSQVLKVESDQSRFFAIVGTGGAGKTTIARKVHGDSSVKNHFNSTALVTISQQWNGKDILIEIIRQVMGSSGEELKSYRESPDVELTEVIRRFLLRRRYLIVIDDIWNKDAWNYVSCALPKSHGSKIIFTTRIRDLPSSVDRNSFIHEPQVLSIEDRYQLIHKFAIENRSSSSLERFKELAQDMAERCSGIPLAVVSLAGILSTKNELYQWEGIKQAMARYILQGEGNSNYGRVETMIALSYYDLPHYLKSCLLYLAAFPEDQVIKTGSLIKMWIGEGLVTKADLLSQQETLEDVGTRFMDELVRRCLLIIVSRNFEGKVKEFRIHDLVRDFCIKRGKEQLFLETICPVDNQVDVQARRLAFHAPMEKEERLPTVLLTSHSLRSLIQFGQGVLHFKPSQQEEFRLLRVLYFYKVDLCNGGRNMLLHCVGELIHLRCLAFEDCKVGEENLLKSIRNLKNLLSFDYKDLEPDLPPSRLHKNLFGKMGRLRRVCLYHPFYALSAFESSSVETLGLAKSENLQVLKATSGGWVATDIPLLSQTLRKLSLTDLTNQEQVQAVYSCPSLVKDRLHSLELYSGFDLKIDLRKLAHCSQLRKLELEKLSIIEEGPSSSPVRFPENLVKLYLSATMMKKQESVSVIGKLRDLKFLELGRDSYKGAELVIERNSFLKLEDLIILLADDDKQELRFEEGDGDSVLLPCLKKLHLEYIKCPPKGLQDVVTLQELKIKTFNVDLRERLKGSGGEEGMGTDFHLIKHIPFIQIVPKLDQ